MCEAGLGITEDQLLIAQLAEIQNFTENNRGRVGILTSSRLLDDAIAYTEQPTLCSNCATKMINETSIKATNIRYSRKNKKWYRKVFQKIAHFLEKLFNRPT